MTAFDYSKWPLEARLLAVEKGGGAVPFYTFISAGGDFTAIQCSASTSEGAKRLRTALLSAKEAEREGLLFRIGPDVADPENPGHHIADLDVIVEGEPLSSVRVSCGASSMEDALALRSFVIEKGGHKLVDHPVVLEIDGIAYAAAQLAAAVRANLTLQHAYAIADGENGGGSRSISWESLDAAANQGRAALSLEQTSTLTAWARAENDFVDDDVESPRAA